MWLQMADKRTKGTVRISEGTYEKMMTAAEKIGYSASQFAESAITDALESTSQKEPQFPRVVVMLRAVESRASEAGKKIR